MNENKTIEFKEKRKVWDKKYRESQKGIEKSKIYRDNNKQYYRDIKNNYRKRNPLKELYRKFNHRARLKKLNITDMVTYKEVEDLYYNKQNKKCVIMDQELPLEDLSPDHIISLSIGGTNTISNFQICWFRFNYFKQNDTNEEALKQWNSIKTKCYDFKKDTKEEKHYISSLTKKCNHPVRLKKLGITDRVKISDVRDLYYNKQNKKCAVLGVEVPLNLLSLDHIVPLGKGGSNKIDNLQLVWVKYNWFKNDSSEEESRADWAKIGTTI